MRCSEEHQSELSESMAAAGIRIPLVEPGAVPALAEIEGRIIAERGCVSLLYRALLNSGPVASGWERMLTAIRNRTGIPADLRELVILRIAVLNKAAFEFEAHAPIAAKAGVAPDKIAAIRDAELGAVFSAIERAVLEATDALTRDVSLPDPLFAALEAHFDAKGLVELIATIAAYNMVSRFLVAFRLEH
jgi:AhpD family alkylhydroperoxidase